MKPLKGLFSLVGVFFLSQIFSVAEAKPVMKVVNTAEGKVLVVTDENGKLYSYQGKTSQFKSITTEESFMIEGVMYKISFGPTEDSTSSNMRAILQPAGPVSDMIKVSSTSQVPLTMTGGSLAVITFSDNGVTVEAGYVGTVTLNGKTLGAGKTVAVDSTGQSLPAGMALASSGTGTNPNAGSNNQPGASNTPSTDQPAPTIQDVEGNAGMGNNLLADMSINLNPQASTPFAPGQ